MRLIVMGQQAFGKSALEKLLNDGNDDIVAVYCAPDKEGRPVDPLKQAAIDAGIPVFQPRNYRDPVTLDAMRSHNADLMIMAYVILFVPEEARDIPKMGSICFHPSLLPLHRGPSSINWPIILGSKKSGFSWFYPTDGLDEGDILMQWECDIDPDDTLGNVYFKKIYPAAIESILLVCDRFRSGNPPRIPQDEAIATYESWCRKADAEINWSEPVDKVYNLIRGTNPQPGSWTLVNGTEIKIYDSRKIDGKGPPGTVMSLSDEGISIQAQDGRILVKRVRPAGGSKISASEWVSKGSIKIGDRLGQ